MKNPRLKLGMAIFPAVLFTLFLPLTAGAQNFPSATEGFESGYDVWTTDNTNIWQVGKPTAGPGSAYAGTNCAGTDLTGNVPAYQSSSLISPAFTVPAATNYPRLSWWQWLQFGSDYDGSDFGDLQISTNNGTSWRTLSTVGYNGATGEGWTESSVDLSAYAGQTVKIAFYYQTGDNYYGSGPGWFVDDVALVTGAPVTLTPNVPVGFESGLGDWSVNNGLWQVGKPTAGPGSAYAGTNCAGTDLTGNVPAYQSSSLISPAFTVPAATNYPRLSWWQWLQFGSDYDGSDFGDLQISTNNGTSWRTLSTVGYNGATGEGWTESSVDLSAYAGQTVKIAFYYQTGDNYYGSGPGWFVDDVALVTGAPVTLTPNVPVGFESGLGDWSVNNGLWQVGKPTAGPGSAYAGTNCAGTDLTGNVPAYQSSSLISPAFTVPAATNYPRLSWWQWLQFGSDYDGSDFGDLQISTNNGTSWRTLSTVGYNGATGEGWTESSVDLSAYAGQTVKIAFYYQTGDNYYGSGPGWFVDDVALVTGAPVTLTPNVPVGFESGLGDWSVNNGLWQVGKPTAGPGSAYAGTNCAGTDLTGNVPAYQSSSLISPAFTVPAATNYPRLSWWQWLQFGSDYDGSDFGDLQISTNNGTSWRTLSTVGYNGATGEGWTESSVDLSAYAGQTVKIAFYYQTGDNYYGSGPGWFVDDVTVWSIIPSPKALSLDTQVLGYLTTPFSVDLWSLNAVAGQQVSLQNVNMSAPNVVFDFSGPNGWTGFTGITNNSGLLTLPTTGTYTMTARGVGGTGGTSYTFDLQETAETNIVLGAAVNGNFTSSGQAQLFVFTLTNGSPMRITLGNTGAGNVTELYVGLGSPPTRGAYNYHATVANSASQQILIPEAVSGTYYVLVYANQISTLGAYTLSATTSGLFLTSVFPTSLAAGADAVLTLSGAGFDSSTTVQLVTTNGSAYSPRSVSVNTFNQMTATFASNSVPVGLYSALVTKSDGSTSELTNVFKLTPGGQAILVTHLSVPGIVGRHEPATFYVQYANTGNAAMSAPLLLLTGTQNPIMALTASLTPVQQEEAFWTETIPPGWSTNLQFLAWGQTPGVLEPGESLNVAVSYGGLQQPWNFSLSSVQFTLGVLAVTNTDPVDWASLQSSMQPANIASDAWNAIFQNFTSEMGPTWGSYVQSLDNASSYLGQLGRNVTDIGQLLKFEIQRADAMNIVPYLAGGLDAYVPTPGVPLIFERVFAQNINGRYKLGALGRGWDHNWDMTISNAPDGSSVTVLGPGTSVRTFLVNTLGGYFNSPGDYGQLTSLGGGIFILQERNGIVEAFSSNDKLNYIQDPNGNRISCGYSGNQLTSLTHSSGQSLSIAYNGFGTIASITDSLGRHTIFGYDGTGQQLTSATYFDGSTVAYSYTDSTTAAANPTLAHALTQITSPTTNHEYVVYDNQGRLANISLDGGAQSLNFSYDSEGTVFVTDANAHTTTFYLNNNGLIAKVQSPFNNSIFFTYDANFNLTTFTDPTGRSYNYAYDGNGNLTQFTDALGKTANFTYQSPFNRLASLVDANANLATYGNDTNGNIRSITYANGSAEKWGYDTVGDPITWTNRRGQAIVFQFNSKGQPLSKIYPDGRTITCGYNSHALLTNVADSVEGVTRIFYDVRDNVTNITYPNGSGFSFTYDAAGRRTSRNSFDGYTLKYGYDAAGRLATLTDGSNNQLVQYTYDANGRLSVETKGNGTITTYGYNSAGQLVALTNAAPGGAMQSFFNYSYDAKGNPLTMTNASGVTAYGYDDLNQLTGVSYPSGRHVTYAYDALGNRTMVNDTGTNTTYTANSLNEYSQAGGTTYGYDADGNMTNQTTASGTTTYQYDAENRLISVVTPTNGTWQYVYDALGNRSTTVYNGVTNRFLLDPFGLVDVAAEYNSSGNLVARYDHGLGLVARVDNGGNPAFYSFDVLGNTRQMTGNGGTVLNSYDYDAFGAATSISESVSNVFRFVGRFGVADEPSGQHFMRARFYDADIGRFSSTDPLNLNGGDLNLYRYAKNNPNLFTDPSGTSDVEEWWWVRDWVSKQTWLYKLGDVGRFSINGINRSLGVSLRLPYLSSLGRFSFPLTIGQLLGTTPGVSIGNGIYDFFHPQDYGNWVDQFGNPLFPPTTSTSSGGSAIPTVQDPNQLVGPTGYAIQNFVVDGDFFAYEIIFANETNATAPAQIVNITDSLSTNLDWTTFQLTGIAFGTQFISIPPNVQYFQTNVPVSYNGFNFVLEIQAGINLGSGQVFANFTSINPTNNLPPPAGIGFLPPDNSNQIGEGHVSYFIRPKPNLPTGLQITNVAYIQFDQNSALATDLIDDNNPSLGVDTNKMALITIDSTPPVSAVNPLPAVEPTTTFAVSWSGTDVGSGIVDYDVYISMNTNAYTLWQSDTPATSAMFTGQNGQTYRFYSQAIDGAGNFETQHGTADAETTVEGIVITSCSIGSNGIVTLSFTSLPNTTNFIEASTNLQSWTAIGIVINTNQPLQFMDVNAPDYNWRFYRIQIATNFVPPAGMALIPPGTFTMGDTLDGETDAIPTNTDIQLAFYMDTNLVSYAEWQSIYNWATNHGYGFDDPGTGKAANHPVQTVDWYDAVKWCNARSQQAGLTPVYYTDTNFTQIYTNGQAAPYMSHAAIGYRLPTEAEWEKAARGGLIGQRFPLGLTISENQANYYGVGGGYSYDLGPNGYNVAFEIPPLPYTSPVGSFAPNAFGLNDMAGDVSEWCWDWYGVSYAGGNDPQGPSTGTYRVARGGSWNFTAYGLRCAFRYTFFPWYAGNDTGFRCVMPVNLVFHPGPLGKPL